MKKTQLALLFLFSCFYLGAVRPAIGGYNVYYGSLHNHCGISDGTGTPDEAFTYAKNTGKLDFFSLADHDYLTSPEEWANVRTKADAYNQDGVFTTFWGFEWTHSADYGHVAVIGSDDIAFSTAPETDTFGELVTWLSTRNAVAFFNHPGTYNTTNKEFDHFLGPVSDKFVGIEFWNKTDGFSKFFYTDGYTSNDNTQPYFDEALNRGWKIGASGAGDNHLATWGTSEPSRMAILSNNLTRTDLLAALRARRFFTTSDSNIALSFKVNSQEMGSTVAPGSYTFRIQASDADGEVFSEVLLYDKSHRVVQTWNPNTAVVDISATFNVSDHDYYYVKVKEVDNGEAVSSPVWVINASSPVPVITSSASASGLPASNAFDGFSGTNWKTASAPTVSAPHWLQIQYSNPQAFNRVVLTSCAYNRTEGYSSRDPRDWTIEGSNNATDWTVLDTRKHSTASPAYCWIVKDNETQHEVAKSFDFTNTTPYLYYKIKFTDSNQSSSSMMLAEVHFSNVVSSKVKTITSDKVQVFKQAGCIVVDLSSIHGVSMVSVIDAKGVVVERIKNTESKIMNIKINKKGLYLVKIENNGQQITKKLIVD